MRVALRIIAAACSLAVARPAAAELDLKRAEVTHLPNGLTVILLEDHSLPMVSVQALYKSGSRDETAGKTGLAHFLEHLAFRGSANFPNAGATEAIYDAGGEWHGYTWLDQTTYFSSMPSGGLDLLLKIEADRMARVIIDPAAISVEKGAVITEMHGYENDPSSVLLDAVTAAAFVSHPYRNNTIGLESDVNALTLEDARDFYLRHYAPANAVLAIAGDFTPAEAKALIGRRFGSLPARPAPQRTSAIEPPQHGVRRAELRGAVDRQQFVVAWPAPAASNPDFAAFLVLQQLLSGGSGVNFRQNDWGTSTEPGSTLHGTTEDLQSWFVPTADRYVFTVKGSIDPGTSRDRLESTLEGGVATARTRPAAPALLSAAKAAVANQLAADVESTEDAAHQLAFFEGIGAFDTLVTLPERVGAVTADEVQHVAERYLRPDSRTIGWFEPGRPSSSTPVGAGSPRAAADRRGSPPALATLRNAELHRLAGGVPVIVQLNSASPNVSVKLLVSGQMTRGDTAADLPGLGTITRSGKADDLPALMSSARDSFAAELLARRTAGQTPSGDPEARLQHMLSERMGGFAEPAVRPIALAISGAVDAEAAVRDATRVFGGLRAGTIPEHRVGKPHPARTAVHIDKPLSQGAFGYLVEAPAPGTRDGLAWRMLLYILTHDYSGRLGRSAIADKGLTYYIGSSYPTDGRRGWIAITSGVDPASADAFEAEFRRQLSLLARQPPTAAEVDAARRHILGRDISGAQTNEEIASKLLRNFVETGGIRSHAALKAGLGSITVSDVVAAVPGFTRGEILRVDVGQR